MSATMSASRSFVAKGVPSLAASRVTRPGRSCRLHAVQQEVRDVKNVSSDASESASGEPIYIGFQKGDYAPRAGRKGRVIKDDPKKYPNKEDIGPLPGVVGGWAGGEAGLWKIREEYLKQEEEKKKAAAAAALQQAPVPPKPSSPSEDYIYVGFGKDELDLRKSGAKGRVIVDDPRKYPNKEDIAFLPGATGGFAGGERGLRRFIEEGEVKLRPEGQPPRTAQFSPVALAGLLVVAGAGGGVALYEATNLSEGLVTQGQLALQPIDENTRTLLVLAILLLGMVGVIGGTRAIFIKLQERMRDGAQNVVIAGGFFIAVYLAARAVLEL